MKTTLKFMPVLLGAALAFSACQRDGVYDPEAAGKVTDIVVPEGFDWKMTQDVELTLSSPVQTVVSVYMDAAGKELLATLPVSTEETTFPLSVPTGIEKVYVKYTKKDGSTEMLPVELIQTRAKGNATVKLPKDVKEKKADKKEPIMYYPSDGWGTLLFEDMWPSKGDYDFNDLAAWYKIQVYIDEDGKNATTVMVSVRLNALGGAFPYQLCLQMDNIDTKDISYVEDYPYSKGDENCKYKWEDGVDRALFSFDWGQKKGLNGAQFYNTEKEFQIEPEQLNKNEIAFMVNFKEAVALSKLSHDSFNFFIRKNDGTEIHLKGYEPTSAFADKYAEITGHTGQPTYVMEDGLVWGLKVPDGIAHAQENVDFCEAYHNFRKWVTSGGNGGQHWYKEQSGRDQRIPVNE